MGKAWERREELVRLVSKVGFPVVSLDIEGLKRGKMDRFLEVNSSDPD
jgi:PP-loop superfamily ATP-utilizing enzyme